MKANNLSGTYWSAGPWWGTYKLSIQPSGTVDKPQMTILEKYGNDYLSAVQKVNSVAEISVYPNPTTDNIRIMSDAKIKSVTIYNNLGMILFQRTNKNNETDGVISLGKFDSGNYIVKILLDDNRSVIKKVVKI